MTEPIGSRIKRRRKELRMSLRDLGSRSRLSAGFLCDLENGRRSVSVDNAGSIAQALDLPVASLFGDPRPSDSVRSLADAAASIALMLRSDAESLGDFHAYAQLFGAPAGCNVYDFALRDALAHRGLTIEWLRNSGAA